MSGTSCTLSFSALIVRVDAHCEMFFFDSRSTSNISRQEKRPPQSERSKYYLDVPNPTEEDDDNEPLCTGIVNVNVAGILNNVAVAVRDGAYNNCVSFFYSVNLSCAINFGYRLVVTFIGDGIFRSRIRIYFRNNIIIRFVVN